MYKSCTRPAWKSQAKQYDAETGAEVPSGNQNEHDAAQNESETQDWYVIDAAKAKAKGKGKKGKGKGKSKSKDEGKTKNKTPLTSEAGYEQPDAGAVEYQAQVYFTTMFHMDDDEVHDSEARPSNWTGDDAAQAAQPVVTDEAESVVPQEERVGSESDIDIDLPPWICSYHDGTARFSSWGHKCCYMCGGKEGDLRRCERCHHHVLHDVHCSNTPVTVEPREGHQVRRSEERREAAQISRSGTQCDEGVKAQP
eukprot:1884871-Amphidinium_carterae.2